MTLTFHDLPPPVIFTHNETLHSIALPPLAEFLTGIDTTDRILNLHDILQRFRTPKSYHRVDVRFVESSELPPKSPVAERNVTLHDVEESGTKENGTLGPKEVNGTGENTKANGHSELKADNATNELSEEEKRERGWPITLPEGMSKADYLLGPEPPNAVDLTNRQDDPEVSGEAINGDRPPADGEQPLPNRDHTKRQETNTAKGHDNTPVAPSQAEPISPGTPNPGEIDKDAQAPPSPIPAHLLPPTGPRRRIRELRLDLRTLDAAALFALETWRRELLGLEKLRLEHPDSVWYDDGTKAESSTAPAKRGRAKQNEVVENGTGTLLLGEGAAEAVGGTTEVARDESEESYQPDEEPAPVEDDSASEYEEEPARPPRPAPVEVNGDAPKKKRGRPRKIRPDEVGQAATGAVAPASTDGIMGPGNGFGTVHEESALLATERIERPTGEIMALGNADVPEVIETPVDTIEARAEPGAFVERGPILDGSVQVSEIAAVTSASPQAVNLLAPVEPGSPLDLDASHEPDSQHPQSPIPSEGEPELDSLPSQDPDEDGQDLDSSPEVLLDGPDERPEDDLDLVIPSSPSMITVSQKRKGKIRATLPKKDSSNFNFPSASIDDISLHYRISPSLDFDMDMGGASETPSFSSRKRICLSTDHPILMSSSRRVTLDAVVIPVRTKRGRAALRALETERAVRFVSPTLAGPSRQSGPSIIALSPDLSEDEVQVIEPDQWHSDGAEIGLDMPTDHHEDADLKHMDGFIGDHLAGRAGHDPACDESVQLDSIDEIVPLDEQDEWAQWNGRPVALTPDDTSTPKLEYSLPPDTLLEPETYGAEPVAETHDANPMLDPPLDEEEDNAGDDEWSFLR